MPLGWFRAEQFRCLAEVEFELDPRANLFIGPNASGKTSLLEAAFFLGRGRSFRSRRRDALIRHGQEAFLLAGRSEVGAVATPLGVRASRKDTEWRVGGAPADGIADLAEQFPAQVIDPDVHKLLEEGPGRRRRFLDWGVFHVEPAFLENWRRYHQALRQRNAALKHGFLNGAGCRAPAMCIGSSRIISASKPRSTTARCAAWGTDSATSSPRFP
jgi:DNA replication and repair protein RecF